jgi:hypothetical protein
VIAQGGDPEDMTITAFLDLAHSVCVDERVRRGMTLWEALEDMKEFAAGTGGVKVSVAATASGSGSAAKPKDGVGGPGEPVGAAELQNVEAMAWLSSKLGGTQGVS